MAEVSRRAWIRLYKDLQRAASQYSYREFARRRIRDYFEQNQQVADQAQLQALHAEGLESVQALKRQAAVSAQYPYRPLVIEPPKTLPASSSARL